MNATATFIPVALPMVVIAALQVPLGELVLKLMKSLVRTPQWRACWRRSREPLELTNLCSWSCQFE